MNKIYVEKNSFCTRLYIGTDANGKPVYEEITWGKDEIRLMHSYEDPYSAAAEDADSVIYVPEIGDCKIVEVRPEQIRKYIEGR